MLCLELGMHETCSCNMVGSTTKSQVFNFYCENHSMCITYVSLLTQICNMVIYLKHFKREMFVYSKCITPVH